MAEMTVDEWCEQVFGQAQEAWIVAKNRGGKLNEAKQDYEKAIKKKDVKSYDKLKKALKNCIDHANKGYDYAKEKVYYAGETIAILKKKHPDEVKNKCAKAVKELETAKEYVKDFRPLIDDAQKIYDKKNP